MIQLLPKLAPLWPFGTDKLEDTGFLLLRAVRVFCGRCNCMHNLRFRLLVNVRHYEEDFFAGATTLCGSCPPTWTSIGSCPVPVSSILVYQGFWNLSLHYPATLDCVFQSFLQFQARKEIVFNVEMSFSLWVGVLATWSSQIRQDFTTSGTLFKSCSSW
jgi:hypothetical protein